jgi:enoyl-CoA hydratase/carnithine racemase
MRTAPLARSFRRGLATGCVRGSRDGSTGRIFIENASKRNAMTLGMYDQVPAAVDAASGGRVTVISGSGDEAFGAGSDIGEFADIRTGVAAAAAYSAIEGRASEALLSIKHPLIASIHGPCFGGALNLALAADLRFAADDATFCVPPGRLGIGYPRDLMELLVDAVGRSGAKDLLFTARVVDAQEALRLGLVQRVLPKAELDAHVTRVAQSIAKLAPLTLEAAKLMAHDRGGANAAYERTYESEDYAEGVRAFGEKRKPQFVGR